MRLLLSLCFIGLCALPLHSQQAPNPDSKKPEVQPGFHFRSLSFLLESPPAAVFAHDSGAEEGVPGVKVDLKNYLNFEANILQLKGDSILFTTKADRASIKSADSLIGSAKVTPNLKSAICLFLPGTGQPGASSYSILVIEDTVAAFPKGSIKVINLNPQPIRMLLEDKPFEFPNGSMKLIENPPADESGNARYSVATANSDGKYEAFSSGIIPHPGTRRVLQIFYTDPKTGKIGLKGIRDIEPPKY